MNRWSVNWYPTCHSSSLCKLAQLCPLKGPLPGTQRSMSSRAYARAYTALYTLYSGLRFEMSNNSVSTLSRSSCPVHSSPPASTQPAGGGANLHWNVYSQNWFTWNVLKTLCYKWWQHTVLFLQIPDQIARLRWDTTGKSIVFHELVNLEILGYFASITCLLSD